MLRVVAAAGAAAFITVAAYAAMSPAEAAGHCSIDPAFGSCAEAAD
jgi:hypothetical protein